jgi:TetR/AcrR family transcriptional regulator
LRHPAPKSKSPRPAPRAPTPPKRRRRATVARIDIVDAAEARFALAGYDATRLEDIGADIGMSRPAVLFHFSDKLELYRAVLDDVFGTLLGEIQFALAGTASLDARLSTAIETTVDYAGRRPSAAHLFMREAATSNPTLRAVARKQAAPLFKVLTMLLRDGEQAGLWSPRCDLYHFTSIIGGAIALYVGASRTIVPDHPYDPLSTRQLTALKEEMRVVASALLNPAVKRPVSSSLPQSRV